MKNLLLNKMALLSLSLFIFMGVSLNAKSFEEFAWETQRTQMTSLDLSPGVFTGNFGIEAFPEPYCEVTFGSVEAITLVDGAGINNVSDADSDIDHEDFTAIIGQMIQGETYEFALEGNTFGAYESSFWIYIDWNQNNDFEDAEERFSMGSINDSNGEDGIQTIANIEVPADAMVGETRMRVIKNFGLSAPGSACPDGLWGQGEDYTINISAAGGGGGGTDEGETCENAMTITSLPFDHAGNIADYGNNYSNADVPALADGAIKTGTGSSYYLEGDDVVYAYTPNEDQLINISTTNPDEWIGLWAFTGCPFDSTVGVHTSTSGATRMIEELPVTAGTTYYFVISSWEVDDVMYTINIEAVEGNGGGETDEDCDQGDDSNNFENGFNITNGSTFRNADDFFVSAGNTLHIEQIELNIFASEPVATMDFVFFEDDGGKPGSDIAYTLNVVEVNAVPIGSSFGYIAYAVFAEVDLTFTEGAYWMQPIANDVTTAFWEVTTEGTLGQFIHTSEANGPWVEDQDLAHGVFKLHCEAVEPPPAQDCMLNFTFIEAITRVAFAGIDNSSPANSDDEVEDFTAIEGNIETGETYEMSVEGDTSGNYENFIAVWIDWNQDGTYDANERYEIGSITNSDGTDGQAATGDILVPTEAMLGSTTMRVIKNFGTSPMDPCGSYSFGQAEDYTIIVGEGSDPGDDDCTFEHTTTGDGDGGSGSSVDSEYKSAVDLVIPAGEMFTLQTIKVPFLTFAPEDEPITAEVVYYEDDSGFPGMEIGNETVVPTILSSGLWINPVAYVFETELAMTPFTFNGDPVSEKTYWIEISMGTATNQQTVFWLYTDGDGLEGKPLVQFNPTDGWVIPDNTREAVYSFSGLCETLGVSDLNSFDFAYYPNPVKDVLNITSQKAVKSVEAFNLTGQKVLSNAKALNGQINVSALTAGTYVFKVTLENGQVETFKIIKK